MLRHGGQRRSSIQCPRPVSVLRTTVITAVLATAAPSALPWMPRDATHAGSSFVFVTIAVAMAYGPVWLPCLAHPGC